MKALRVMIVSFMGLFGIIVLGIIGFMYLEGFSFLDASWLTITTLSTVGYGDVVPKTIAGRYFNLFLIIIGVGTLAYTLGGCFGFIVEGRLKDALGRNTMQKRIEMLRDHVIVCGAGRIGENVISTLDMEKKEFVIIEKDEQLVRKMIENNFLVVTGDATENDTLEDAGVRRAHGLISTLGTDAENVFVTLTAREKNPRLFIVARAILRESEGKLRTAGADRVISPAVIGGVQMASVMLNPLMSEFLERVFFGHEKKYGIEEIKIFPYSCLVGKAIKDSSIKAKTGCLVISIIRDEQEINNPCPEEVFQAGDVLFVLGNADQLDQMEKLVLKPI